MRFASFVFAAVLAVLGAGCEEALPVPLSSVAPSPAWGPLVTSFRASSYPTVGVGQRFFVLWEAEKSKFTDFYFTGPVACRPSGSVASAGCATCTASGIGALRFALEARGGNDGRGGAVSVSETLTVNSQPAPVRQPAAAAALSCDGGG
ncbi:MAG: hypothetical protein HYS78_01380 [Parcubacteria group bacterium]|nr:hypothetical protein [Parcubacteria group bacterium]